MSASLVGSEMCIRDSTSPSKARQSGSSSTTGLGLPGANSWRTPGAQVEAVSYTHLTLPTICSV
eukprot:6960392-Alexandrium_andersonii.AAC.1